MTARIIHLPLSGGPMSNAYGFPPLEPVDEPARVQITACLDGYRVWLFGKRHKDFVTLSNASRCASALMTLDSLDALP
jgi:hypothetical protein